MKFTVSIDIRRGATMLHNMRIGKTRNKNIDETRTAENIVFWSIYEGARTQKQIEQRREKFLSNRPVLEKAIEDFNKGKKPSRQTSIKKEMEKEKYAGDGQKVKLLQERTMIIQIGNDKLKPEDTGDDDARDAAYFEIYKAFENLPGVYITDARIHKDETTPHLNLSFYTIEEKSNKKEVANYSFDKWTEKYFGDFIKFREVQLAKIEHEAQRQGLQAEYQKKDPPGQPIKDIEKFKEIKEQENKERQQQIDEWEKQYWNQIR